MKILLLDIETAPNIAYVWGMFKENIPLERLIDSGYVMCWAAKWFGEKEVMFSSIEKTSQLRMLKQIHKLLDEADAVVHYYGTSFDIPTLNREFIIKDLGKPAPYKQIDLCEVVKKNFRFTSNKLDHVCERLNLGTKHSTDFKMWVDCMAKKPEAWKRMEQYNKQDVLLLEKLYIVLRPWIKNHANVSLYVEGGMVCPNCGSADHQKRGFSYTQVSKFQRHQCRGCGNWFRSNRSLNRGQREKYLNIQN